MMAMASLRLAVIALGLIKPCSAVTERAPATLAELLEKIAAGSIRNGFQDGEVLKSNAKDDKEACAACLLDKVSAIVDEGWSGRHAEHLLLDLGSCCTKDGLDCHEDVSAAYALLREEGSAARNAPRASALLIKAAKMRVKAARVKKSHAHYLDKCSGDPKDCTMEMLSGKKKDRSEL
eukprot:gb/GFBE01006364.1/.p1 GENE.gb/GFBE01006364.1/~~gb/GFBE01006364.1/.p1  ORF type:complete len:178 (+),score=43.40 gb/GFBE01006364.1/:1-534(+)